jgi:hypothetical protein
MTHRKPRFPWTKRARSRRAPQPRDDHAAVFKTFVQVLARMRANAREAAHASFAASREKV